MTLIQYQNVELKANLTQCRKNNSKSGCMRHKFSLDSGDTHQQRSMGF